MREDLEKKKREEKRGEERMLAENLSDWNKPRGTW